MSVSRPKPVTLTLFQPPTLGNRCGGGGSPRQKSGCVANIIGGYRALGPGAGGEPAPGSPPRLSGAEPVEEGAWIPSGEVEVHGDEAAVQGVNAQTQFFEGRRAEQDRACRRA